MAAVGLSKMPTVAEAEAAVGGTRTILAALSPEVNMKAVQNLKRLWLVCEEHSRKTSTQESPDRYNHVLALRHILSDHGLFSEHCVQAPMSRRRKAAFKAASELPEFSSRPPLPPAVVIPQFTARQENPLKSAETYHVPAFTGCVGILQRDAKTSPFHVPPTQLAAAKDTVYIMADFMYNTKGRLFVVGRYEPLQHLVSVYCRELNIEERHHRLEIFKQSGEEHIKQTKGKTAQLEKSFCSLGLSNRHVLYLRRIHPVI